MVIRETLDAQLCAYAPRMCFRFLLIICIGKQVFCQRARMELEAVGVFESNAQRDEEMNKVKTKEVCAAARHPAPGVWFVYPFSS